MIVLSGGDLVLPDRLLAGGSLIIDGARLAAVEPRDRADVAGATVVDARDCYVVPGFVDVHVHGIGGFDTLDEGDPIAAIAARLPRHGVTAFCPTTTACPPAALRAVLAQVARARAARAPASARVLPAHLESNFINPEYRGAQPAECLRLPPQGPGALDEGDFSARDILDVIAAARPDVGIVTLAPELPGALDLVRTLVAGGHRVSLGHSGADLDQAVAAMDAGARHATHLFNRMTPMTHRAPGLAGAVLASDDIAAELICDGYHVHPVMSRMAIAAKGTARTMAITDATAGAGLPVGSTARLGGRRIRVTDQAAVLDEGTLAGSTLTMERAFRTIVTSFGLSVVDAAVLCATTPARELGLTGFGFIAEGAVADLVVLDRGFRVVRTFIDGQDVFSPART
ncbi:MAG: N-acetylglucosamine-6-phosphate deacetylase [Acidobacteria bacterium]|nr:N-acetylglucosamine-6-phosphate deacetylase [Acidobacteriota bacterium]